MSERDYDMPEEVEAIRTALLTLVSNLVGLAIDFDDCEDDVYRQDTIGQIELHLQSLGLSDIATRRIVSEAIASGIEQALQQAFEATVPDAIRTPYGWDTTT